MPNATYYFPKGFIWGTATAAHQVEGQNYNNNWFRWEKEGHVHPGHSADPACDWWRGRWKEDFDHAAETGQNAHRMSIEWSRIQTAPDQWDEDALAYYREMITGLIERGLQPMVTLHHFTDPLWIYEMGGWENDETPIKFVAYVEKVVAALSDLVSLWVTINEPNVYTYGGYLNGGFPPGKNNMGAAFSVMLNLLRGHALAYHAIHRIQPEAQVGVAHHYRGFWPARTWSPLDKTVAKIFWNNMNAAFPIGTKTGKLNFVFKSARVPEAVGTQDFFGLNYYSGDQVAFVPWRTKDLFSRRYYKPGALMSATGFLAHHPEGMFEALKWAKGFNLPIHITENGAEDPQDHMRPRYLVEHLYQVWRAATATWPVKSYFHWSLVDNFEWERGWTQRFGLWGLDLEDNCERVRRKSVDLYAAICQQNAISAEIVQQYSPDSYPILFPG